MSEDILVTTIEEIPGKKVVKVLGVVTGSSVRARHLGKDIAAGLRSLVGGEIKEYTELLAYSREEALRRLKENARKLGANAVIGLRFSTSAIASNVSEILAYGTAVVVEEVKE